MKNKKISYCITNTNLDRACVFIHGYMEPPSIWDRIIEYFNSQYKTIIIELPGYSVAKEKRNIENIDYNISEIARNIWQILTYEGIEICNIIDHSMGGYIALEMTSIHTHRVNKLVLLHSHPFADTERKKKSRLKEVDFIKAGKQKLIINGHFRYLFVKLDDVNIQNKISEIEDFAVNLNTDVLCKNIEMMAYREDKCYLLNFVNTLFITSKIDPLQIHVDQICCHSSKATVIPVDDFKHFSFSEDPEKIYLIINNFLINDCLKN